MSTLLSPPSGEVPPFEGADHVAWIRWRLIDDLLQRHFTDIGLEPGFGMMGTELYNVALHSPTCHRAPRYFGRLCGTDVHPEDDSDLLAGMLGDNKLTWAGAGSPELLAEGTWDTWSDYLQDAIATLSLGTAGITGHEGCFHRRGKALTPLMYRVGLLLRTDGGRASAGDDNRLLTLTAAGNPALGDQSEAVITMIRACEGEIPTGPPRFPRRPHRVRRLGRLAHRRLDRDSQRRHRRGRSLATRSVRRRHHRAGSPVSVLTSRTPFIPLAEINRLRDDVHAQTDGDLTALYARANLARLLPPIPAQTTSDER